MTCPFLKVCTGHCPTDFCEYGIHSNTKEMSDFSPSVACIAWEICHSVSPTVWSSFDDRYTDSQHLISSARSTSRFDRPNHFLILMMNKVLYVFAVNPANGQTHWSLRLGDYKYCFGSCYGNCPSICSYRNHAHVRQSAARGPDIPTVSWPMQIWSRTWTAV